MAQSKWVFAARKLQFSRTMSKFQRVSCFSLGVPHGFPIPSASNVPSDVESIEKVTVAFSSLLVTHLRRIGGEWCCEPTYKVVPPPQWCLLVYNHRKIHRKTHFNTRWCPIVCQIIHWIMVQGKMFTGNQPDFPMKSGSFLYFFP